MTRPSYAAWVQLQLQSGEIIYAGEAIYRPAKPHPITGEPAPQIGIPDDAMETRPSGNSSYQVWFNGETIDIAVVYLERIATCWWLLLDHPPRHPPTV